MYITECRKLRDAVALLALVGLRTQGITWCTLRAAPCAPSLAAMTRLTDLDLSGNPFGVAGAIKLMSLYLGIVGPESRSDDTADKALPGEQWSRPALATVRDEIVQETCEVVA